MSSKIQTAIWDMESGLPSSPECFDDFEKFYEYVIDFKNGNELKKLQVHIPGSFILSDFQRCIIGAIGIISM